MEYLAPTELEDVLERLRVRGDETTVLAGGTAVVLMLKQRLLVPDVLLSLGRLPGLDRIVEAGGELRLGARATHRAVERATLVQAAFPALAEAYHHVASVRIRNVATVGGSLAHADPSQDPPVALMALDARAVLTSAAGKRELPLSELFVDYYETLRRPDELLTEVCVPLLRPSAAACYSKLLPRSRDDYATVSAAARIELDPATGACTDARLALGCVAPTVVRACDAEALLIGRMRDRLARDRGDSSFDALLHEAGRAARAVTDPISDARGSAEYKRDMSAVMARRAIARAWDDALARCAGANA